MRYVLWILPLAALLAGCVLTDCDFDVGESVDLQGRGALTAEGADLGDTLTVAFVTNTQAYDVPELRPLGPREIAPARATGQTLELAYQLDGFDYGEGVRDTYSLASTLRGDTLFVYVEGTLSPDLFTEVCSPPDVYLGVFTGEVRVPERVRAVRLTHTYVDALVPETAAALRQLDADRPRPALTV